MAKKRITTPVLIFVANDAKAQSLSMSIPGSRIIDSNTGPLAFRRQMVDHANGEYETLIATPAWATGWRAPLGTKVIITDGFPADLVEQAMARVPAGRIA